MSYHTTSSSNFVIDSVDRDVFHQVEGILHDFYKMAAVDWDEAHEANKLTPRRYTWNAINIIRLTLTIWILASHVAIAVFIVAKQLLRNQPKNLLIVNVALANVIMGIFVIPLKLHFILHPRDVNCDLAVGWTFVTDYFQPSVSLFAVVSLVFERFVYVYTEKNEKNIKPWATIVGTIVMMVAPWLLTFMFSLPLFYGGLVAKWTDPDQCLYKVDGNYFVALQLMSFIVPSLGVFILAPFTGLLDCLRPKRCFYKPLTPKGESMAVTATVSLFSIFCEAPYCIVRVLMMTVECNSPYCSRFSEALTLAMWVRICKASISPFIWLAYTDIRKAMLCKLSPRKQKQEDSDYDSDNEKKQFSDDAQNISLTHSSTKPV